MIPYLGKIAFWLGLAAFGIATLCALSLSVDGFSEAHMEEDRTVEMAGAMSFLIGALMCAVAVLRGAGRTAMLVGILSIAAFLSEMSFGERQFGFDPPEVQGVKIDAVHDVMSLSYAVVDDPWVYLLLSTTLAAVAAGLLVYLIRTSDSVRMIAAHPTMPLVAASLALISAALFTDFGFGRRVVRKLFGDPGMDLIVQSRFEEAAEFVGALLLLVAALRLAFAPLDGARQVTGTGGASASDPSNASASARS